MATVSEALNIALDHHLAGRVEEAGILYARILDVDPDNPHALHLSGLLAAQSGRLKDGADLIRRAIRFMPLAADFHGNLGKALQAMGDGAGAAAACRNAVLLQPESAVGWFALGNALLDGENVDTGGAALDRALAASGGAPEGSEPLADAFERLGMIRYAARDWPKAAAAFRTARRLAPTRAGASLKLGAALARLDDRDGAIAALDEAARLDPTLAEAHVNLLHLLVQDGRFDEAGRAGRAAVALEPGNPDAYGNMVPLLEQTGRIARALAVCDRSIRLAPGTGRFHENRLSLLLHAGRIADAVAAGREAVRHAPDSGDAHFALATALLAAGSFKEGWDEFEWRWRSRHLAAVRPDFSQPLWQGGEVEGRTVLLHAEQGLGDTLQFIRYAPLLARRGARVVVGCPPGVARLLRRVEGVARVVSWDEELPPFDLHCPLMSLPRAFGTAMDTIPAQAPYLHADPADIAAWRDRLPPDGRLRVGLVWAGSPRPVRGVANPADRRRSVPLAAFAPLGAVPGVHLVSLQMGPGAGQLGEAPAGLALTDPMGAVRDFADTAALVENLDLVISVDTSVAHLAGGLGRPVWLLSRADACWRWLGNREDSPWYPTMRVFGQTDSGVWTDVIGRVRGDLAAVAAGDRGRLTPRSPSG